MRDLVLTSITILASNIALAGDLTMKIARHTTRALVGERISLLMTISGDKPFTLPEAFTACGVAHHPFSISVTDDARQQQRFKWSGICSSEDYDPKGIDHFTRTYSRSAVLEYDLFLLPGKYQIHASYTYDGNEHLRDLSIQPKMAEKGLWRGHLESNAVAISVEMPQGIDEKAFAALAIYDRSRPVSLQNYPAIGYTPELLEKFPDSRYAALAVRKRAVFSLSAIAQLGDMGDLFRNAATPASVVRSIRQGGFPAAGSLPTETGWRDMSSRETARWQADWIARIRKTSPDLLFPEDVQITLALNELAWGDSKKGLSSLQSLNEKKQVFDSEWLNDFITKWGKSSQEEKSPAP